MLQFMNRRLPSPIFHSLNNIALDFHLRFGSVIIEEALGS